MPSVEAELQFQPTARTSKDFELFGVAWRYNEVWYAICVAECVFSTSPADLFGDQRLGFDQHTTYDETLSVERGVDTNTAAKATPGNGKPMKFLQAKNPFGKQMKGTPQTGLVAIAPKDGKPAAVGNVPRASP